MNCKQATELASRQKEAPLGLGQKINLKVHLLMCKHCQNFDKNIEQLSNAMQNFLHDQNGQNKDQNSKNKDQNQTVAKKSDNENSHVNGDK